MLSNPNYIPITHHQFFRNLLGEFLKKARLRSQGESEQKGANAVESLVAQALPLESLSSFSSLRSLAALSTGRVSLSQRF
jgi:hypothetical protein